jgi:hypothetical protein
LHGLRRLLIKKREYQAVKDSLMITRLGLPLKVTLALAVALVVSSATPAIAQTGAEYPRTMPGGGIPGGYGPSIGGGGGSISAPAPSGSGPTKTKVIPYGPEFPPGTVSHRPKRVVHKVKRVPEENSHIEPAQGHLKLIHDSFAYELRTPSSKQIEPVHAGKFVNVIGTSRHYAQVKLKNSEIAYIPLTAIQLVKPTDKTFKLTANSVVFSAPNESSSKISEVHKGHDVHAVGIALNYMKIRMKDGKEGFIPIHALE